MHVYCMHQCVCGCIDRDRRWRLRQRLPECIETRLKLSKYRYIFILHMCSSTTHYADLTLVVLPSLQSARVEKLEADVKKYRQKAEDTEYLRKRIAVSCLSCLPTIL